MQIDIKALSCQQHRGDRQAQRRNKRIESDGKLCCTIRGAFQLGVRQTRSRLSTPRGRGASKGMCFYLTHLSVWGGGRSCSTAGRVRLCKQPHKLAYTQKAALFFFSFSSPFYFPSFHPIVYLGV